MGRDSSSLDITLENKKESGMEDGCWINRA